MDSRKPRSPSTGISWIVARCFKRLHRASRIVASIRGRKNPWDPGILPGIVYQPMEQQLIHNLYYAGVHTHTHTATHTYSRWRQEGLKNRGLNRFEDIGKKSSFGISFAKTFANICSVIIEGAHRSVRRCGFALSCLVRGPLLL